MIYGKITLEDWRTVCVEGEEPESSFEKFEAAFPKKEKLKLPGQLF